MLISYYWNSSESHFPYSFKVLPLLGFLFLDLQWWEKLQQLFEQLPDVCWGWAAKSSRCKSHPPKQEGPPNSPLSWCCFNCCSLKILPGNASKSQPHHSFTLRNSETGENHSGRHHTGTAGGPQLVCPTRWLPEGRWGLAPVLGLRGRLLQQQSNPQSLGLPGALGLKPISVQLHHLGIQLKYACQKNLFMFRNRKRRGTFNKCLVVPPFKKFFFSQSDLSSSTFTPQLNVFPPLWYPALTEKS